MNRVALVGHGMTEFSMDDLPIESLLAESARNLFNSCGNPDRSMIHAVITSTNNNAKYLSQVLSEMLGIRPRAAHTLESLCNSGTNAIVSGYSYIAAGLADAVLVSGAERHDSPGRVLEWDLSRGEFAHPIYWGSVFTRAYKQRHDIPEEDIAAVAAKNHKQAAANPYALPNPPYTLSEIMSSRQITDDLKVLECSQACTGGASVLLASEDTCSKFTDEPVWITGIGQKSMSAGFAKTERFDRLESTAVAARDALAMSRHTAADVDVAEVHDAFAACEPMALESIGIADAGHGARLARDLYETGNRMINPRGGLIGAGHPLGATGVAQTAEIASQLKHDSGTGQADGPKVGLVHNMAAAATSSTVLVLEQ